MNTFGEDLTKIEEALNRALAELQEKHKVLLLFVRAERTGLGYPRAFNLEVEAQSLASYLRG